MEACGDEVGWCDAVEYPDKLLDEGGVIGLNVVEWFNVVEDPEKLSRNLAEVWKPSHGHAQ